MEHSQNKRTLLSDEQIQYITNKRKEHDVLSKERKAKRKARRQAKKRR